MTTIRPLLTSRQAPARKRLSALCLALAALFSLPSLAANVDGEPSFNGAQPGIYTWRDSSGRWHVRQLANSAPTILRMNTRFEGTANISDIKTYEVDLNDSINKRNWLTLDVALTTNTGQLDGANFMAANSKLCMRVSQNTTGKIFLGRNKVAASTPVDLTGNDACGNSPTPPPVNPPVNPPPVTPDPPTQPPTSAGKKFNKGHYIALLPRVSSLKVMEQSAFPGVRGLRKNYTWRALEPQPGVYDFSGIEADLAYVQQWDLQLIIFIQDKTFRNDNPMPDHLNYLKKPNKMAGFTAVRWDPQYITRYNALISAMAARFDDHPNFEGISTTESSPSLNDAYLNSTGYTPEKYRDALINVLSHASRKFSRSRIFWNMNFMPRNQSYLASVANAVAPLGVVMGGPDITPDDRALSRLTYPLYDQFKGRMPMWGQVEPSVYHHVHKDTSFPTKYWTMPELFQWSRANQHISYMFWTRFLNSTYPDSYDLYDALPVIRNNPNF